MKTEHIPYPDIEAKWQKRWLDAGLFKAPKTPRPGKKFYCLDMYPYPSADGLHVGHPEGYTATDILCRFRRRRGDDVLHPMGWDAFGLPAENFALQTGTHPRIVTQRNIATFKRQIQALGFSYDWDREIDTTDPGYYRWTQWIFLQLFKKGLAYEGVIPINWCPSCKTGLANEEVFGGACERCGSKVERRDMRQWLLKITVYAERLLQDLDGLDWPQSTLAMQRNWIGRSEGALVSFRIEAPGLPAHDKTIEVFTTRPDTLYGATYMVLAPEHPLVPDLLQPPVPVPDHATPAQKKAMESLGAPDQKKAVESYIAAARAKSDIERSALDKEKTGEFTGSYAVNPLTNEKIPIWIADYVLATYGTGAIMAVPAHDERDFEFAVKFGLDIKKVVRPPTAELEQLLDARKKAYCNDGVAVNSPTIDGRDIDGRDINGLPTPAAKAKMIGYLQSQKIGKGMTTYKLRDWVFSRQRYWGEPIPIVHCEKCGAVPVPEKELPVLLPDVQDYKPTGTGESPLAAIESWVKTKCPTCGGPGRRETNTMPQWAGSCWYYLRFLDPKNDAHAWDKKAEKDWMSVDCYVGGAEHAVLHLLYSRFWHKVLFDLGFVSTKEPFQKLRHQGMILSYSYRDSKGVYHHPETVEFNDKGEPVLRMDEAERENGTDPDGVERNGKTVPSKIEGKLREGKEEMLQAQVEKMSKSKKNVVNPDAIIARYGADVFRMYEMFMGPFEDAKPWDMRAVEGIARFLRRVWVSLGDASEWKEGNGHVHPRHQTIAKVGADIDEFRFNTAISALMIYLNKMQEGDVARADAETLLSLLNPFAPHLTEELWEKTGHKGFLSSLPWPAFDPKFLKEDQVQLAVQINGKVRDHFLFDAGAPEDRVREAALALPKIRDAVNGRLIVKVVSVKDRLVNIVVR